jgi:hypothetical protein
MADPKSSDNPQQPPTSSAPPVDAKKTDTGRRFTKKIDDGGRVHEEEIDEAQLLDELRPWYISAEAVRDKLIEKGETIETKAGHFFKYKDTRKK